MVDWRQYIELKPEILFGKPIIKNTRIAVDLILEKLASGDSISDITSAYPNIVKEDVMACILFHSNKSVKLP